MSLLALGLALLAMLFAAGSASAAPALDLDTLSGTEAEAMLEAGEITSVELTEAYLERIEALNKTGPGLNAVTQINKYALAEAAKSDSERALGIDLGPAMGLPILLKDIIDAKGMYTSAGDWALRDSYPEKDSGVAKELRAHGVILLGKARPLGVGEQLRQPALRLQQPHRPGAQRARRGAGAERLGSGSGAAASSAMAALTIGTETSGSIISPSTSQGDVGLRPTLGLVPGYGIAPIDASQDTAGPIVRTVSDAAITLRLDRRGDRHRPRSQRRVRRHDGPALHGKRRHPAGPVHRTAGLLRSAGHELRPGQTDRLQRQRDPRKPIIKAKEALEAAGATMVLDEATEQSSDHEACRRCRPATRPTRRSTSTTSTSARASR